MSQPVISGIIAKFTPLIEASTEVDQLNADEAKEAAAREQTVLVDGFLGAHLVLARYTRIVVGKT